MEYKRGDRQITLPCKHLYHAGCGTRWLSMNKASCFKDKYVYNRFGLLTQVRLTLFFIFFPRLAQYATLRYLVMDRRARSSSDDLMRLKKKSLHILFFALQIWLYRDVLLFVHAVCRSIGLG